MSNVIIVIIHFLWGKVTSNKLIVMFSIEKSNK
jgi:hypothetical protein